MEIQGIKFNYQSFINKIEEIVEAEKFSGEIPADSLQFFTMLNLKRMQRLNKTLLLDAQLLLNLKKLSVKQNWVVITETWCGDSAQILPVIAKIAEASSQNISLNIITRDENPEWISKYHTNGSHSIPKLIGFDESGKELFVWGPRPVMAQSLFINWKANNNGKAWKDFEKELHTWYVKDKTNSTQLEINKIIQGYAQNDYSVSA
ncbi:MAG: thioredoxin family protein [Bacteroidetes bacterium]|nr:thioredoxin family protein [Bacteroidota bacterium]